MIRKLCAFLAALLVAVTLVACNTAQDSDKPDPDPGTEVGESLLYGIGEPFAGSGVEGSIPKRRPRSSALWGRKLSDFGSRRRRCMRDGIKRRCSPMKASPRSIKTRGFCIRRMSIRSAKTA